MEFRCWNLNSNSEIEIRIGIPMSKSKQKWKFRFRHRNQNRNLKHRISDWIRMKFRRNFDFVESEKTTFVETLSFQKATIFNREKFLNLNLLQTWTTEENLKISLLHDISSTCIIVLKFLQYNKSSSLQWIYLLLGPLGGISAIVVV
jgi:hypothetical protein